MSDRSIKGIFSDSSENFLLRRPRRNRASKTIRGMVQETFISKEKLICPLFLVSGERQKQPISAMPGQYRFSKDIVLKEIEECLRSGISSFILFPVIDKNLKDRNASYSYSQDSFYLKAIREIKSRFKEICIITDTAMDPYSSEGHDGLVKDGIILNDETLPILSKMALAQAEAGADIIGPSDMMDGRVKYLRESLDRAGHQSTGIMSYTAKYASAFYGPFREALDSAPKNGDKKTYQMSPANRREALIEAFLDEQEGADFLMVKPALLYLDVIKALKDNFNLPIAAYNVSGEYSMIKLASQKGLFSYHEAVHEVLLSIKRAGADAIITYFAKDYVS